jgi:plastocyanin
MRTIARAGFTLAVGIALAACSSGATTPTNAPAASSGGATAAPASAAAAVCAKATTKGSVEIEIEDFKFKTEPIQAKVGDTITWTNKDTTPHSAAPDNNPECATDTLNQGSSGSITYTVAGTYPYHCAIHPTQMKGTIVVSG